MLDAKDLEMLTEIVTKAVEPVREDVAELKKDVAGLKEDVTELKEDVAGLKEEMSAVQEDLTGLQQKVTNLQEASEKAQKDMADIRLTLENEVIRGIHIIGEGHLDLNRKMNQILETKEERELMELRVLSLEHEVRRIKDRLEIA